MSLSLNQSFYTSDYKNMVILIYCPLAVDPSSTYDFLAQLVHEIDYVWGYMLWPLKPGDVVERHTHTNK